MKKLLAALVLASLSVGASAAVINDLVDPPNVAVTTAAGANFNHNILDNGFTPGFDTLVSALLSITLTDPNNGQEKLYFVIGSGLQQVFTQNGNNNVNNGGSVTYDVTLNNFSLADLGDGMLAVFVGASSGEFAFAKSELSVTFTPGVVIPPPVTRVPEPFSISLIGLGLLALGSARRRMR